MVLFKDTKRSKWQVVVTKLNRPGLELQKQLKGWLHGLVCFWTFSEPLFKTPFGAFSSEAGFGRQWRCSAVSVVCRFGVCFLHDSFLVERLKK
jgi:hypothetical protein